MVVNARAPFENQLIMQHSNNKLKTIGLLVISMSLFLIFLNVSCKYIQHDKPFSKKETILHQENPDDVSQISEIITSQILSTPKFDSLPFSSKIGDDIADIRTKLEKLNLYPQLVYNKNNEIWLNVKSTIYTLDKTAFECDSFAISSTLYFQFNKLAKIWQQIGVPSCFIKMAEDLGGKEALSYKSYTNDNTAKLIPIITIMGDSFLPLFKAKYGVSDYIVTQHWQIPTKWGTLNGASTISRTYRYIWLKEGVLINLYILHNNADGIQRCYYYDELPDTYFISIIYSSAKKYLQDENEIMVVDTIPINQIEKDRIDIEARRLEETKRNELEKKKQKNTQGGL